METNRFVSTQQNGLYKDGKEITSGPDVKEWAGSLENYTFSDENGNTLLSVNMDTNEDFKDYFEQTWPKVLKKLKEICES